MSIATVSSTGKQLNKMYEINIEIPITDTHNIHVSFYSTKNINTLTKLKNFLDEQRYNKRIFVFGGRYTYQSDVLYIPYSLTYDSVIDSLHVGYYVNDGQGWRISYFSRATFNVIEV